MPSSRAAGRWLALATFLVAVPRAEAFHTVFDYGVDRVEADGNAYGPADGVLDFVDEFDDGALGPAWSVVAGTAREEQGILHLTNPGSHFLYGAGIDVSEVSHTTVLRDGDGDFTITSAWAGGVRQGDFVNLVLFITGGTAETWEFFGAALWNFGSSVSLQQYRGEGLTLANGQTLDMDAATAAGPFLMRVSFDDATNLASASFSFDDGATFQSPFEPIAIFNGRTDAVLIVGADPSGGDELECCTDGCTKIVDADADGRCDRLDNCRATANGSQEDLDVDGIGDACDACVTHADDIEWRETRVAMSRVNDGTPGNEGLQLRGILVPPVAGASLDPAATGLRLQVHASETAPLDLVVPAGGRTVGGGGWKVDEDGTRFVYRDGGSGPRDGIRKVTIRRRPDGTARMVVSAPRGPFQTGAYVSPPLKVGVVFTDEPSSCGEFAFESAACRVAYDADGLDKIVCR